MNHLAVLPWALKSTSRTTGHWIDRDGIQWRCCVPAPTETRDDVGSCDVAAARARRVSTPAVVHGESAPESGITALYCRPTCLAVPAEMGEADQLAGVTLGDGPGGVDEATDVVAGLHLADHGYEMKGSVIVLPFLLGCLAFGVVARLSHHVLRIPYTVLLLIGGKATKFKM